MPEVLRALDLFQRAGITAAAAAEEWRLAVRARAAELEVPVASA